MKIHFATYADSNYLVSANTLASYFLKKGIKSVDIFSSSDLGQDFVSKHRDTLSFARGAGYWIWKPKIIMNCLARMSDGEILIYMDSGVIPKRKFFDFLESCPRRQVTVWETNFRTIDWTDSRVVSQFERETKMEVDKSSKMVWAGAIVLVNDEFTRNFIGTWLQLCEDPRLLRPDSMEDYAHGKPKYWHRHDQSLLSLLIESFSSSVDGICEGSDFGSHKVFNLNRKKRRRSILLVLDFIFIARLKMIVLSLMPSSIRIFLRRAKATSSKKWLSQSELNAVQEVFRS